MSAFAIVALMWDRQAGKLTDEQETQLFRELVACPELWPNKINETFRAKVLAKLEKVTQHEK